MSEWCRFVAVDDGWSVVVVARGTRARVDGGLARRCECRRDRHFRARARREDASRMMANPKYKVRRARGDVFTPTRAS